MRLIKSFSDFITESKQEAPGWPQLYAELSKLNSPKIIKWKDADGANVSLNWGSAKEAGHRVGISIANFDPRVMVVGDDAAKVKAELLKAGLKDEAGDPSWNGIDPKTAIAAITNAVKSNLVHENLTELEEEAETSTPPGAPAVINYTNPVSAEITKDESRGKQNVIKFKSGGTTRYYKIVGSVGFKDYDLNFKWIKKEPNGDLQFARYTSGGVDIETIPYNDMATVIKGMNSGSSDINPVTGIHFYKI